MNKITFDKAIEAYKIKAKNALQTVYDVMNHGQQKQMIKNEDVKKIFDCFGVEYTE